MNRDEKIAETYLKSRGFVDVIYEPDGNVPPDFLVNGITAVEVRKLNQHFVRNGKAEPLQEVEYKLIPMLDNLLKEFEGETHNSSAFVCIAYSRPLGNIKKQIKKIKCALINHLPVIEEHRTYQINDSIEIEILPASDRHSSPYVLGAMPDMNAGGFVVSETYKNLKLILEEKTKKISNYRNNYQEWWLVLVDYIGHGLSEWDAEQLRGLQISTEGWDKVILVSPVNHNHGIEI